MEKVYYLDDNNEIVPSDKSTHVAIHVLDDNGEVIEVINGRTGDQKLRMQPELLPQSTSEQAKFLEDFERRHREAMSKR